MQHRQTLPQAPLLSHLSAAKQVFNTVIAQPTAYDLWTGCHCMQLSMQRGLPHLDAGIAAEFHIALQEVLDVILALGDGQRVHLSPAPKATEDSHPQPLDSASHQQPASSSDRAMSRLA